MDPASIPRLRRRLLDWYDRNRRDLPWRVAAGEVPDPYAIWVSEVMLQQTRVETVRGYYERWLDAFPTLADLAAAPEDKVLKVWEGLGYYSRARNFHRAAREVGIRYGGRVPSEPEVLRSLPGVGRYTAGAVASIAFGKEAPIVDGNVRRVFARLLDRPEPTDSELWELAGRIVVGVRPGDLNQALMELGATVCTPRSPSCGTCPARDDCAAHAAGTVAVRPAPKVAKTVPVEHHGVAVVVDAGLTLIVKRPETGLLAGMWEFPGARRDEGEAALAAARRAAAAVRADFSPDPQLLCRVTHAFTHLRVVYEAFVGHAGGKGDAARLGADDAAAAWVRLDELGGYALPKAQRKIAAALGEAGLAAG